MLIYAAAFAKDAGVAAMCRSLHNLTVLDLCGSKDLTDEVRTFNLETTWLVQVGGKEICFNQKFGTNCLTTGFVSSLLLDVSTYQEDLTSKVWPRPLDVGLRPRGSAS